MRTGRIGAGVALLALLGGGASACGKASAAGEAPSLSKSASAAFAAAPAYAASASPGVVPCGTGEACPATKHARKVCCNAPGVPATCKAADKCGQATKFRYSGMLSCNETADCTALDKGRDVVCCLSDDGFRAESVPGPYNRASCMPRVACAGSDVVACVSDAECPKGTRCRAVSLGVGVDVGGCLP